jgi:hypothetical protein
MPSTQRIRWLFRRRSDGCWSVPAAATQRFQWWLVGSLLAHVVGIAVHDLVT